jgi:hypothetical protein
MALPVMVERLGPADSRYLTREVWVNCSQQERQP